jgi:uncharacterized protein YhaN
MQIVLGANEQGKTTLRHFIADMLYGQKRPAQRATYEDGNELRRPWMDSARYGGRLWYVLNNGHEIEVHRVFERNAESIQVFDRTHGKDVTGTFERYKNRELNFAESHLGISKVVFIGAATIGPMSLESLGDAEALGQIRETLLSIADAGDESGSAEIAVRYLDKRIEQIGRPAPNSKRPLPAARSRLAELDAEQSRLRTIAAQVAELESKRRTILDELNAAREQRDACARLIDQWERWDRARRLDEAERIEERMRDATQRCFQYRSVQDFPLESAPDVQRAANVATTTRNELNRRLTEREGLLRQLADETQRSGEATQQPIVDVPEPLEQELAALESRLASLRDRSEAVEHEHDKARERLADAQHNLDRLPDFSRIGPDPAGWLSNLDASFRATRQTRDQERAKTERLSAQIQTLQDQQAQQKKAFAAFHDFPREARDFTIEEQVHQERTAGYRTRLDQMASRLEEIGEYGPVTLWLTAFSLVALIGLLIFAAVTGNNLVYVPAALFGALFLILAWRWHYSRAQIRNIRTDMANVEGDLARATLEFEERRGTIMAAVRASGFTTLRELEALYEQYSKALLELQTLEQSLELQTERFETVAREAQTLFAQLRQALESAGQHVASETDAEAAVRRALSSYQEYRDAKRRLGESRDRPAQLQLQLNELKKQAAALQDRERECALEARRLMREGGFRDESKFTSALAAVRAYQSRAAQTREKRGRIDLIREQVHALERRLQADREALAEQEGALGKLLAAGGASSLEQWDERARQARLFREARDENARLQERLDTQLNGVSLIDLRRQVESDGPRIERMAPGRDITELRRELRALNERIESLTERERAIHIDVTERTAGRRSLNEVEEERAAVEARLADLELELEAASHAAALIEEFARDKHARIAPRLAAAAGRFLHAITNGAYAEVLVSHDFRVGVRVPQTNKLTDEPERRLSKGTVDQIYFALRLALVQALSTGNERIPLLLDDPFANYDDARLENALRLLLEVGEEHQVLLFTCRGDLAQTGQAIGIPVLSL